MRGSCVQNRVCRCAPGSDGCAAGAGVCPFPGTGAPCELPLDGTAAPQPASALAPSIEHVCPGVMDIDDLVCCDDAQLATLKQQLDMAHGLLANCPACFANFRRFWCVFTCSPQQGSFVEVTNSRVCDASLFPGPNSGADGAPPQDAAGCDGTPSNTQNVSTVQSVRLRVDEAYATALFDSCKDVTVSATGQKAVDMAFGGARSAADFLHFQGVTAYASGQNPLKIEVLLVNSSSSPSFPSFSATRTFLEFSPEEDQTSGGGTSMGRQVLGVGEGGGAVGAMLAETVACDVQDGELGCLCNDCSAACPPPPPPLPSSSWYAFSLEPLYAMEVNSVLAAAALALGLFFAQVRPSVCYCCFSRIRVYAILSFHAHLQIHSQFSYQGVA
jgi:hypothetical protein